MKRLIIFGLLFVLLHGCSNQSESKKDTLLADTLAKEGVINLSQQDSISAIGREVLTLIKAKNYQELVKYFAGEGVRFSPYAFIDTANSKKLTPEAFLESINKKWTLTWGSFDGTGDPIKLTVPAYIKKFVYNADYLNAEAVGYNEVMKKGNSINNLKDLYPNHHFIEYHFSGFEQKYNGMDWTSLRLVFEKQNGQYFIVAIIHDLWTT